MGPQRSIAAVVAAGLAVIASVVVVVWVATQPRGSTKASAAPSAVAVAMPGTVDETDLVQAVSTTAKVPAGMTVGAAMDAGLVSTALAPLEMVPQDFVSGTAINRSTVLGSGLDVGVVLTKANVQPSGAPVPVASDAVCPTDWTGTLAADHQLVFVVTAPVTQGTSVAKAFASGSLRPYSVSKAYAPRAASPALAPVCKQVAAFDLTRGTVLTSGTFVAV